MRMIIDTCVWSQFLRRREPVESRSTSILRTGIRKKRIQMLGIIRQELLSGIQDDRQRAVIADCLSGFPDLLAESVDHTTAAAFYTTCRAHGVQGSPIDFLICAQASRHHLLILTDDRDFTSYARYLPIRLL